MTPEGFLAHAERGLARIAEVGTGAGLDADVPSCPDWDLRGLVTHTTAVCRFMTGALVDGVLAAPDMSDMTDDPRPQFQASAQRLVDALRASDPAAPAVTWGRDKTGRFWRRRAALEFAVHAWDAEGAVADPSPIDPELAADGIDELFEEFTAPSPWRNLAHDFGGAGETIHLHATDVEGGSGEWLITCTPESLEMRHEHAKGDVAARGRAADLLLFLWGRAPAADLEVFGDASLLDRWQQSVRL